MSAREDLKDLLGIFNPSNAATYAGARGIEPAVYLSYRPADNGRGGYGAAWQVIRPGYKTDPDSYWRDYGNKTFNVYSATDRALAQVDVEVWATDQFGYSEWVKITGVPGALFPKPIADLIKTDLAAARKAVRS